MRVRETKLHRGHESKKTSRDHLQQHKGATNPVPSILRRFRISIMSTKMLRILNTDRAFIFVSCTKKSRITASKCPCKNHGGQQPLPSRPSCSVSDANASQCSGQCVLLRVRKGLQSTGSTPQPFIFAHFMLEPALLHDALLRPD